jgi:DNA-binding protein H-NS
MSEFISILTHARRLKAAVEVLTLEQLQEVSTKLIKIIDDRFADEADERRAEAEKLAKIEKYKEMLEAEGLSVADVFGLAAPAATKGNKSGSKRAPRPAKYEYYVNGERGTWTGQGRMPNALKVKIEHGESLENFLIKG